MSISNNLGKLFIISAPSGAGKTTLVMQIIERVKGQCALKRVITYTTKTPRPGEVHGIDYHFISEADFKEKIEQDFFIEHSTVYGAYYGFPKEIFWSIEQGEHFIAIVDRAGAVSIRAYKNDAILIWISPPSESALEQRLSSRAQDDESQIALRLSLARQEIAERNDHLFDHIIINDELSTALAKLEDIIKSNL